MMTDNEQQKIAKLQQILDEHGLKRWKPAALWGPLLIMANGKFWQIFLKKKQKINRSNLI